ncbi:MAG TPA: hypothetical protein VFM18_03545 [Methanosarcina sp.]|nr:hypothetical protein [Methanosarcina sp.]
MKKGGFFFLFVLLSYYGSAQISLGVKTGYGYFTIINDNQMGDKAYYSHCRDNIILSIEAKQNTTHLLNLGVSLDYVNQSFNVSSQVGGHVTDYKADAKFTTGSLYFGFKPQFTFGKQVRYFFYPGFIFGTVLHSYADGIVTTNSMDTTGVTSEINHEGSSYFAPVNFGFLVGMGMDVPLSSRLTLNIENTNNILSGGPSWGSNKSMLVNLNIFCGLFYRL